MFGSELEDAMKDPNLEAPIIVIKCIEAVDKRGNSNLQQSITLFLQMST